MPLEDLEPLRAEIADQTSVVEGVKRLVTRFTEILTDLRDRLDPLKNVPRLELRNELDELVKRYDEQNALLAQAVAMGTAAADEAAPVGNGIPAGAPGSEEATDPNTPPATDNPQGGDPNVDQPTEGEQTS